MIFSASLKPELERISEENQGIREVFVNHREQVSEVNFDDPVIRLDLNTPDTYEAAKKQYGA